ncbi:MAG: T9SS type A sorting domain-containing protein, partial [Ginsengibacter sp.]
ISATSLKAVFTFTGGNMKDLTKSSSTVASNLTINVIVYDNGEPGGGVDQMYYEVKNGATVLYTSTSPGSLNFITKGNIQIHVLGAKAAARPAGSNPVPAEVTKLGISAYPNPFTDKVKFLIESPVSGKASLDIFNVMGQKLHTVYQGYLFAGQKQTIDYHVPSTYKGSLIYTLKVGDQHVNGKVIQIK